MNCFIINITKKKKNDIFVAKSLVTERANKLASLMWKTIFVLIFLPSSNSASEIKDIRE